MRKEHVEVHGGDVHEEAPPWAAIRRSGPRRMANLFLMFSYCTMAMVCFGANAKDMDTTQQYEQDIKTIDSLAVQRDITELEKVANSIHHRWRGTNQEKHAQLTLRICQQVGSGRFGGAQQTSLPREHALVGLEQADKLEIETELALVGYMMTDISGADAPKGRDWAQIRRVDLRARLHAWKRLRNAIIPAWDPNDRPLRNVSPPSTTGLPAGVSPNAVREPELRKEYEAAIEANRQKAETYRRQYRLRNLQKVFEPLAEEYIIRAYSKPPLESKELQDDLVSYGIDPAMRKRILEAVQKKAGEK